MRTTIDGAGRLVIPKTIRQLAGLQPGAPLDVRWHDGRIEIEPAALPVTLVRSGRFVVAVPIGGGSLLSTETVEETRDGVARGHETGL